MAMKRKALAERFWPKVDRRGPDECWNWTAYVSTAGYGYIGLGGRESSDIPASRASFFIHHGYMPARNLDVCHTCDNRLGVEGYCP